MLISNIPTNVSLEFNNTVTPRELGDCRTQAFCMMLNHYGSQITVLDIFGIGNELSFHVHKVKYKGVDVMAILGRTYEAEMKCCSKTGISCEEKGFDYDLHMEMEPIPFNIEILEEIAEGHPVLLQCDVYYMTYLDHIKRNHNQYHMVIALGYDLNRKELTVLDSVSNNIHKIDMLQMYKAMFEKQYVEERKSKYYVFKSLDINKQAVSINTDLCYICWFLLC